MPDSTGPAADYLEQYGAFVLLVIWIVFADYVERTATRQPAGSLIQVPAMSLDSSHSKLNIASVIVL